MAKQSVQIVKAFNMDTGRMEDTPADDVFQIECIPPIKNPWGGDGTPVIPATERMFARGCHLMHESLAGQPVYRYEGECYVRHENDARDVWFSTLAPTERARILTAVREGGHHG